MSQDEVLRCLVNLKGSASLEDLTHEYNSMHFPRNTNYSQLDINTVKKTLQGDISKLLRDHMISRIYMYPPKRTENKQFRKYAHFTITQYGYKYIKQNRICELINNIIGY